MAQEVTIDSIDGTFGIKYYDNKNVEIRYVVKGKDFDLESISQDEDTSEIYYGLRCDLLGEDNTFKIPKSEAVDSQKLFKYAIHGLDIDTSNSRIVPEVIRIKADEFIYSGNNSVTKVYSVAGVRDTIDSNGNPITVYAGNTNPITGAEYIGPLDLQPHGSLEGWVKLVRKIVDTNIPLMFILSVAFGSILLGFLKNEIDVDNLIVHLRNDSSSGKTTAEMLAISVFGSPDISSSTLISSWNSTKNALLRRCMNTYGITLGLDELSMLNERNISNTIYSLATGIEKDRLTREAQVQDRLKGNYFLISTGECSMLAKTNNNIGLTMRILEMEGIQWTTSAEESENIKKVIRKHNGLAATEFGLAVGMFVQTHGIDSLLHSYESWRQYYQSVCCMQERKERMSTRIALILLGASIASNVFDIDLDPYAICEFIVENEKNTNIDAKNSYNGLYDRLISYISANQDHFRYKSPTDKNWKKAVSNPVYGLIEDVSEEDSLVMINGQQEEICSIAYINEVDFNRIITKELGYEDSNTIITWLKKKNYSITECDRNYIRKMVDGARVNYVAVYIIGENKGNRAHKETENTQTQKSHKRGRYLSNNSKENTTANTITIRPQKLKHNLRAAELLAEDDE